MTATGYTKGEIVKDSTERIINSRTHPFPGETWDGTEYPDMPSKYTWAYKDENEPVDESSHFLVYGYILDEDVNTGFNFKKAFKNIETAHFYFEALMEKHPKSQIIMAKKSFQYLRYYH